MRTKQQPVHVKARRMTARQKEFTLKFYRWALKDAQREYSEEFPLLRRIKSTVILDYVDFVSKLSPDEKRILRVGMVKRVHAEGALLAGDKLTEREDELIERYLKRNIEHDRLLGPVRVASEAAAKRWEKLSSGSKEYQIDRQKLRAALKKGLSPTLGERIETFGSNLEWAYPTPVGRWTVYTWVDTGGRLAQLSYHHTVSLAPHVYLVERTSILSWLGIPGTYWDLMTNADIPHAVESVALLSSHFIKAMSKIEQAL
jgi:hypothetical protein